MRAWLAVAFLTSSAVPARAQPTVVGASVTTHSAASGLEPAVRALLGPGPQPLWIGWSVPAVEGHNACCGTVVEGDAVWCGGCRLENEGSFDPAPASGSGRGTAPRGPVALENDGLNVLLRVDRGRIVKLRSYSSACALDTGGRPLRWLTGVRPAQSVAYLAGFLGAEPAGRPAARARSPRPPAEPRTSRRDEGDDEEDDDEDEDDEDDDASVGGSALAALALHADASADAVLERLVAPERPVRIRKRAAFWMGVARGRRGYETLRRIARDDPDTHVRSHVAFALSQSKVPEALDSVIEMARRDASTRVRGQALFWLSQKAGRKAAAAIEGSLRDDPDTAVKKKAVFALSQLPKDEGVPLLIQVARTNRNPAVRKQAIFWLGQSKDQRALSFFEEVLAR